MAGPNYRFTQVRDHTRNSHLRFYINYLYYKKHNTILNGYDFSVMHHSGLKHHFTEMVAEYLNIETELLASGEFGYEIKRTLNRLLNDLRIAAQEFMLPDWYTNWVNSERALFFFYSAIKVSIDSNILITRTRYSKIHIGQYLWPTLSTLGQQKRLLQDKENVREIVIDEMIRSDREEKNYLPKSYLREKYSNDTSLTEEKVNEKLALEKEELQNIQKEYNSYLEALRQIENYDPTIDDHALEKIIDHFNFIAFTGDSYQGENARFVKSIKRLYKESYADVPTSRNIVKNDNPILINKTYERLVAQYQIHYIYTPTECPNIRQQCIIAFLDILNATTINEEFKERFKLIGDKFSLDKGDSADFTIELPTKQWEMLIELAKSKYPSKIKATLNKIIRQEYKTLKQKRNS